MNQKDIKKLLKDTLNMEQELYDFCIECLNRIYGENAKLAINDFESGYDAYDWNGCIQSLSCIDNNVQKCLENIAENKAKKEKEKE